MSLHEKIIELSRIRFDVKFEPAGVSGTPTGVRVSLRHHGPGAVKVENCTYLTPENFTNEKLVVHEIEKLYREMKPHAIGHQTFDHQTSD